MNIDWSERPTDWGRNKNYYFIIAGSAPLSGYILNGLGFNNPTLLFSSKPPSNWMTQMYNRISCLQLRQLCIPGTHDSGMSKFGANRGGATAPNTLTQYLDVYHQLAAGARWLDIRPVISGGHWFSGHYSGDGQQGANGQSLQDIISNINKFISEAQNKELIFVRLSNVHNTDSDDPSDACAKQVTQKQWQNLLAVLKTNTLHLAPKIFSVSDISSLTISQLIQHGPAVIYIIGDSPCDAKNVSLASQTLASYTTFNYHNEASTAIATTSRP